jgi:mannosyltransferase OCH1-like enzyme
MCSLFLHPLFVAAADAIRPFILHAVGGVYLDLDSECFSSMQPWLDGPQLVLQAEVGRRYMKRLPSYERALTLSV